MKPSLALASHRKTIDLVVPLETTPFDIGAIRHELLRLLGMPVDHLTPRGLPEKFRDIMFAEAVPV